MQYDDELNVVAASDDREDFRARWDADIAELDRWLAADPPTGHVLELAAGSGNRTGPLLRHAEKVTALDAAPEMLELLREKHPAVEVIEADVFSWQPPQLYDNVYFGFWMSHVPTARWQAFWRLVERALVPGGRVWFVDNAHPEYANTRGPGDWPEASGLRETESGADPEVRTRTLFDGSEWTMVKRFWLPEELVADLGDIGWLTDVHHSTFAFIYGTARRS